MTNENGKKSRNLFGYALLSLVVLLTFAIIQCTKPSPAHDPSLPSAEGAALAYANGDTVYVKATRLNVRDKPNLDGQVIDSLASGLKLKVLDRSGEWIGFEARDSRSWVSAKFVTADQPSDAQTSALGFTEATRAPTKTRSRPAASRHSFFAKECKTGKPCGNACISRDRVCHK